MAGAEHDDRRSFFALRSSLVLIAFIVIAGFYLLTEHRAHLFGALPWLLLLACPLLHLFMHGGHGGHGGSGGSAPGSPGDRPSSPRRS